jgi:DNA (cytosine-5)-methyltransferase 1
MILPQFSGAAARSIDDPLGVVTTTSRGIGLVDAEPFVAELRNGKTANSIDDPLSTVTTLGAHHGLVEADPFVDKFYGTGVPASVDDPLDTVTAKARFGLCQIGDQLYDVHFRMLKLRELARASGFPDTYWFAGGSEVGTKLVGNAVPIHTAEALIWELIR